MPVHIARSIEFRDPLTHKLEFAIVSIVRLNAALDLMFAGCAGLPKNPDGDLAAYLLLVENDLLHDEAQDTFAVFWLGGF
ncbi:MAG: hypothetical protein E5X64_33735 [Mesorhizobium sp.]|nr:MAG: hypothetical protein E5X64_33735 [Mesorhizobium sp.]